MPVLRFSKAQQLTHDREYQRVYSARASVLKGPLRIHGVPRGVEGDGPTTDGRVPLAVSLPTRIGLSVPGRVGTNVKRNRIKRLIREAFRLNRAALPTGFDFVIGVHPHEEKTVEEYAGMLASAAESLAKTWEARRGVGGGGRR